MTKRLEIIRENLEVRAFPYHNIPEIVEMIVSYQHSPLEEIRAHFQRMAVEISEAVTRELIRILGPIEN